MSGQVIPFIDGDPDGPALVRAACEHMRIAADCLDESGLGGSLPEVLRNTAHDMEAAL